MSEPTPVVCIVDDDPSVTVTGNGARIERNRLGITEDDGVRLTGDDGATEVVKSPIAMIMGFKSLRELMADQGRGSMALGNPDRRAGR